LGDYWVTEKTQWCTVCFPGCNSGLHFCRMARNFAKHLIYLVYQILPHNYWEMLSFPFNRWRHWGPEISSNFWSLKVHLEDVTDWWLDCGYPPGSQALSSGSSSCTQVAKPEEGADSSPLPMPSGRPEVRNFFSPCSSLSVKWEHKSEMTGSQRDGSQLQKTF
jgi:hypothetical protein